MLRNSRRGVLLALLAVLLAGAGPAEADQLRDRISEVCTQAVADKFRNRGRADNFEDLGSAFAARVYVNNRDYFNCRVTKDFRQYTLFDMAGKRLASGSYGRPEPPRGRDDGRGQGERQRIASACAQAVGERFGVRGQATHFEDFGNAYGARVYVNERDYYNCHVTKDYRQYTLFDMGGRTVARGALGAGPDHRAGFGGGEIVVYEQRGFRGGSSRFRSEVRDLARQGINDAISSVRVLSGAWQICSDADYQGRCIVVEGDVPDLADYNLNNRVSSFRPVRR